MFNKEVRMTELAAMKKVDLINLFGLVDADTKKTLIRTKNADLVEAILAREVKAARHARMTYAVSEPVVETPAVVLPDVSFAIAPQEKARWLKVYANVGAWNGFDFIRRVAGTAMTHCQASGLMMRDGVIVRRQSDGQEFLVGLGVARKYLSVTIPSKKEEAASQAAS